MNTFCKLLLGLAFLFLISCQPKSIEPQRPGSNADFVQLPNGWRLTPVGRQVSVGEFPLNMLVTADQKHVITSNSGTAEHSLSLVSIAQNREVQRLPLSKTWRGLAANSKGDSIFVSGGNDDCVYLLSWQADTLVVRDTIDLKQNQRSGQVSVSGLAYWPKAHALLAMSKTSNQLYLLNLQTKSVENQLTMPGKCYEVCVNPLSNEAWISVWEKAQLVCVDLNNFSVLKTVRVGDHPSEMALTGDGKWLFVANANQNSVSVVDMEAKKVVETLHCALKPDLPPGSTPNSLALSADGQTLYVANADNNYLALFDVHEPGHSRSLGFIPVGWYPTSVRVLPRTGQIIVANGKGLGSAPNPQGPKPGRSDLTYRPEEYIGQMFKGVLSIIDSPDRSQLAEWTVKVFQNTPFMREKQNEKWKQTVVPVRHDGSKSSKIKYVFYVIRENRTYDQVLGDLPQGEGDSALCLFPRAVTPNAHKLAETFVLFDNFYVDAEVSADGHNWSTAAYATDYVEKTWPTLYGGRGGSYDFENAEISRPTSGYIWDNVLRHGISLRDYGEYVEADKDHPGQYVANTPGLKGHVCPTFPGWNLRIPDTVRFAAWQADFDSLLARQAVPQFNMVRFPNDHTAGTRPGFPTVLAMIAENDYALGLFVQHLSHSPIWKESVVFVLEDDAQNGSDHVDAHRSPLLVIGPYVKRGFVDHTMYSTSSVLKTMELILGLPPMTQYDLAAQPILKAFTDQPDFRPYTVEKPQVRMDQLNTSQAYGAQRCNEMNLSKEDAIPDIEFNEIIWKAVKGSHSEMPPPVRSAFVQVSLEEED